MFVFQQSDHTFKFLTLCVLNMELNNQLHTEHFCIINLKIVYERFSLKYLQCLSLLNIVLHKMNLKWHNI